MTTAKNSQLVMGEYKFGGMGKVYQGYISCLKQMSKLLASGGGSPSIENPGICCLFVSLSDLDTFEFFGLSPRSKLATKHEKEF